ncbi:MAG: hypothetical protein AAFO95_00470 [Cyanobacteria bacterium J06600_6]
MSIPKTWQEATKKDKAGNISLSESWANAVEEKIEQHQTHELYALRAANDGQYACKHCQSAQFFLKAGEIYRYGTTGVGQEGRGYSEGWLARKRLTFVHIQYGDLATVKTEEALLIGHYVIHPENLARPVQDDPSAKIYWYRLVLPPGNNNLD